VENDKVVFKIACLKSRDLTARRTSDNNAPSHAKSCEKQLCQAHRNAFYAYIRLSVNQKHAWSNLSAPP